MVNGWKVFGIVLLIVFILENLFITYCVNLVMEDDELTQDCYYGYCGDSYNAYYDVDKNICYCYDENNEITKQKYLK